MHEFFSQIEPCLIAWRPAARHYWGRELKAMGHEVLLMPRLTPSVSYVDGPMASVFWRFERFGRLRHMSACCAEHISLALMKSTTGIPIKRASFTLVTSGGLFLAFVATVSFITPVRATNSNLQNFFANAPCGDSDLLTPCDISVRKLRRSSSSPR